MTASTSSPDSVPQKFAAISSSIEIFIMLESIASGTGNAVSFASTYYRVRNIHVSVTKRNPRFINFGAGSAFFEHIDEQSFGTTPAVHTVRGADYETPPSDLHGIEEPSNQNSEDEPPTFHYIDPSFSDIAVPVPPAIPQSKPDGNKDYDREDRVEHVFISTEKEQPMLEVNEHYLPEETFLKVAKCLVGHPAISSNPLDESAFSGTTGFATQFSGKEGVRKFLVETKFNCDDFNPLLPFYEAALDQNSTAFIMNVLVADMPRDGIEGMAVGKHVDNTLKLATANTEYYPHSVNVLYLEVPDDITGGHLDILGLEDIDDDDMKPIASVFPEKNKMATMRGDAYHQVRGYDTSSDEKRISLVFEQYRIHPQHESDILEYETSVKTGMTMM